MLSRERGGRREGQGTGEEKRRGGRVKLSGAAGRKRGEQMKETREGSGERRRRRRAEDKYSNFPAAVLVGNFI